MDDGNATLIIVFSRFFNPVNGVRQVVVDGAQVAVVFEASVPGARVDAVHDGVGFIDGFFQVGVTQG